MAMFDFRTSKVLLARNSKVLLVTDGVITWNIHIYTEVVAPVDHKSIKPEPASIVTVLFSQMGTTSGIVIAGFDKS
jgi:hypothetical protein